LGKNTESLQTKFNCSPCLKKACAYNKLSPVTPACYQALPAKLVLDKLQALMT